MTPRPGRPREEIVGRYPFDLDQFQLDALDALDRGHHVIVAAPTGSGKTVVAEYAIGAALDNRGRSFYTAPIKALSNQKYHDLRADLGDDRVGLLTGDVAVNGDADVVVMTTEVLRNMIYAGRDLSDLHVVVLDEVHFLQDAYRGPVWEEVIVHLPEHVQLVCLSATVSNADDLGEWIETVRGPTEVVVEHRRPVALDQYYFVADRTHQRQRFLPTLVDGRPNGDALRLDAAGSRHGRMHGRRRRPQPTGERTLATPTRGEVIGTLQRRELLPAIYFIFSRAQCDEAARAAAEAGFGLGERVDRERLNAIATERLAGLDDPDLDVLGYEAFMRQLEAGVAAHHAGLVPPFKEVVEQAFLAGLVQVVFATETLALGINMPARSVVIEKLSKFTGDQHELLTPGQFTQLTGRAGRRGIDERGAATVLWSPFVRFDQVAELALSRSFHLRSAFRPTYNMAANLVRTYERERARQLLSLSFAQHQADREIVRIERRLQHRTARLDELEALATSPYGDLEEFRRRGGGGADTGPIEQSMEALRPGEVIHVSKGKHHGPAAVVATAHRAAGLRVTAVTPSGHALTLSAGDFGSPVTSIGQIVLPGSYSPNRTDYRKEVGRRLHRATLRRPTSVDAASGTTHPVEADPDLQERLAAARQADRTRDEIETLRRRAAQRTGSLARDFDEVLGILGDHGYVDVASWRLTRSGETLSNLFHESDLLIAEVLHAGLLDGRDSPTLAGLVSGFVYEHRSPDEPPRPWFPDRDVEQRWREIERISTRLAADERRRGLTEHRAPDPGFIAAAYAWVAGESFADLVEDEELTGGDFVRTTKQLVDLLGQIAGVATGDTALNARRAAEAAKRGVVADTSVAGR